MIEPASYSVLSSIPLLIPGIEQVLMIHSDPDAPALSGYLLKQPGDGSTPERIQVSGGQVFFQNLWNDSQSTQWFQKNQLPFEISAKDKIQLTLFSELKNNILLIKYSDIKSLKGDLFFIYFNENLSNFFLEKADAPFSTQNKAIVAYLLSQSVNALYIIYRMNNDLVQTFGEQILGIVKERDSLREDLEQLKAKNQLNLIRIAQHHLNTISRLTGKKITLTDSARLKIREYTGEIQEMEKVMRDAVEFAARIDAIHPLHETFIADYHIRFPSPSVTVPREIISDGLSERLIKTHQLLDKMENAAVSLRQRKMALTSSHVGKEFPMPVSAPAISDALKKHKKRIIQLFEKYPDKWEIIRHNFRPVQNILNERDTAEQASA
jgi:hypothetical protein